jgi:hypothetical protein
MWLRAAVVWVALGVPAACQTTHTASVTDLYSQFFFQVVFLEDEANRLKGQGQDDSYIRSTIQRQAGLTGAQGVAVASIALDWQSQDAALLAAARALAATGANSYNSPRMLDLQNQRQAIVLDHINQLQTSLGTAVFQRLDAFVHGRFSSGPLPAARPAAPAVSTLAGSGPSVEQPLETRLAAPVGSYTLAAERLLDALVRAAGDFHLPMGIEWIKATDPSTRCSRSWQQTTPLTILRDIASAYPGYELAVENGVVHVFPAALRGDSSDILNLRIGRLEVQHEFVNMAAYRLARQVKNVVTPPDPARPHGWGASIASGLGDWPVTLKVEDGTVRDVLDRLCLAAGENIWVVAYPKEPAKTRAGYLKTIRLDTSVQTGDEDFVPSWAFLVWGRPVPGVRE